MLSKNISLRGLEVFDSIARTGSVAKTAEHLKLSLPAVSQQLKNLEEAVGRPLVDHTRRPMQLTTAGRLFRRRTDEALKQVRQGLNEASVLELSHLSQLRMGVIDDFDNQITPDLVTTLAGTLVNCEFRLTTRPSHELCAMSADGQLDVAVATSPDGGIADRVEYPLLQDPFILIVPRGLHLGPDPVAALKSLAFLRYDREQMIGRQIEAQLRRLRLGFPSKFELGSNSTMHALVGQGRGWTVTTALSYLRAERFHDRIDAHPLPFAGFSRIISLFAAENWIAGAAEDLAQSFRTMLGSQVVQPTREKMPWLGDKLTVLPG